MSTQPQKPTPMTATQARAFDHYSLANAAQLAASLECNCQPYEDIFTYNRWKAQGYQVRRGQKAQTIVTYKSVKGKEDKEGKGKAYTIPGRSFVFCRCQVDEITRN